MDPFEKLANKIKIFVKKSWLKTKAYFKRLLFPLYLFPLKLITYTVYYLIKFVIKFIFAFLSLIFETIIFPFKSLKNFLKAIFLLGVFVYLLFSFLVIIDYIRREYGWIGTFYCFLLEDVEEKLKNSVVRIVGGYSEGSGFFIAEDQVITNFHVIADEPSPKIILPDGRFITPIKILGHKDADLALLFTEEKFPQLVMPLPEERLYFNEGEKLLAAGYPLGTELSGKPTVLQGKLLDFRKTRNSPLFYAQVDINLVEGMSGGPLVNQCGKVVGINNIGVGGLSLFILADNAKLFLPHLADQEIKKIEVDPSKSPEEAVRAFYTYIKARRMKDGFALLSREYLKKTNFEEWTSRFKDVLDVTVFKTEMVKDSKDTVYVKFGTKNWVDNEVEFHYYEGTWQTVFEDGVYKMKKSRILEINNPSGFWFWE
ncbi:MAG: S1 family peptidase [Microgenomates group bacterium]